MKRPKQAERLREERARIDPTYIYLLVDEVTARCVSEGIVTVRLQEQATRAIAALWPERA